MVLQSFSLFVVNCTTTQIILTGLVNVTCKAISGGQCVNWTITPSPNGSLANVANLHYRARGGKLTYIGGQYYNTFRINITNS